MTTYLVVSKDGRTTHITTYTYSDAFEQAAEFCGIDMIQIFEEV